MTPEGKVKKAIRERLAQLGFQRAGDEKKVLAPRGWYYMPQNMGMGVSGIPDFVGSYVDWAHQPRPFGIEAKARGEKPTALQQERHVEMRAAGWFVLVVDDVSKLSELEVLLG